jgi:very-short-patch-repair endonuclease
MVQPKRKGVVSERYKRKTSSVNKSVPINKERGGEDVKVYKKRVYQQKKPKAHPEYGTSKLEERFAKNFLDKLGVKYIYQYKMESIGRFLDFMCVYERVAIEIDGDYYHSYGLVYEKMSPMQKKNYRVDKEKDHWCLINGIQMIRIWEHDINEHPESIMKMLKEKLGIARDEQNKKNEMKRRH